MSDLLSDQKPVRHYADAPPAGVMVQGPRGTLDMSNGHDLAMVRSLARKQRYPISEELRKDMVRGLTEARDWADGKKDYDRVERITKALAALDKMNQDDEHLIVKTQTPELHEHRHLVKVIRGVDPEAL